MLDYHNEWLDGVDGEENALWWLQRNFIDPTLLLISQLFGPQMKLLEWLQGLVSRIYYVHGMFCAKHPCIMILLSSFMVIFCCLPFLSLPMSMTVFHQYTTPLTWFHDPDRNFHTNNHMERESYLDNQAMQPQWFSKPPVGYVLQVVVNSSVYPWQPGLDKHDAFRGPLAKAFDINSDVQEYVSSQGQATKSLCYYVTETAPELQGFVPQHSCLVISPANAWTLDYDTFLLDDKPVKSLLNVDRAVSVAVKPELSELLIGFSPWQSGFKRHLIRSRSRQITYAVTVILHTYNESFVRGLQHHLQKKYNPPLLQEGWSSDETILHIHYKNVLNLQDISALGVVYCLLLLYVYFSVSQIDMVKSKWGIALSATVLASLSPLMAVGVTLLLGVETTLNEGEIFPYLVIIIGLENTLVITNSVASTSMDQDVPTRIAVGLCEEGWYITKNLVTGTSIVFLGYFTFVPAIQEFCILALIAMLTDFFLQMFFFVPVLSIDFRRKEWDETSKTRQRSEVAISITADNFVILPPAKKSYSPFDTLSPSQEKPDLSSKVPFLMLLASRRILQRFIMAFLLLWIIVSFLFIYHSGLAQYLYESINNSNSTISSATNKVPVVKDHIEYLSKEYMDAGGVSNPSHQPGGGVNLGHPLSDKEGILGGVPDLPGTVPTAGFQEAEPSQLEDSDRLFLSLWLTNRQHWRFSAWHWPALLNFYNISLSDRYISILPPIKLQVNIQPSEALTLRIDSERRRFVDFQGRSEPADSGFYSQIRAERDTAEDYTQFNFYVTLFLGVASGASLVVLVLLLFWCVRIIHNRTPKRFIDTAIPRDRGHLEHFMNSPTPSHKQEVEVLISKKGQFISACPGGEIRVWDCNGHELMSLDRSSQFRMRKTLSQGSLLSMGRDGHRQGKTRSLPRSSIGTSDFGPYHQEGWDGTREGWGDPRGSRSPSIGSIEENGPSGAFVTVGSPGLGCGDTPSSGSTSPPMDAMEGSEAGEWPATPEPCSPIWCLTCNNEVLFAGCLDGRIELWDINYGVFLSCFDEGSGVGVTDMVLRHDELVVSRLDGTLQFLLVGGRGRQNGVSLPLAVDAKLNLRNTRKEHQGPINQLLLTRDKVVSAGQDCHVKVFSIDGHDRYHNFHGHTLGVTTLGHNARCQNIIASGSVDGTLCTWNMDRDRRVHRMKGHHSPVLEIAMTGRHIGSIGMDSRFCIWDQQRGLLLHTIQCDPRCSSSLVPLTDKFFVTAAHGSLIVWDIATGKPLQGIDLGDSHQAIRFIVADSELGASVMCDYGRELRLVQFHLPKGKGD